MAQDLAEYSLRSSDYSPNEDWIYFEEKLLQEAPRLFQEDSGSKVLLEFTVKSDPGVKSIVLGEDLFQISHPEVRTSDAKDFYAYLSAFTLLIVTKSIINQANSWAELSVTLNAFQAIFSRHNISAAYISYVRAFGYRVKDEECSRSTYYWKIDPASGSEEFCYNTKYISRNGRAEGDTWSIRQTGIYEKRNMNTGQSVWILLQPSERVHRRLREGFVARSRSDTSDQMVTTLHAALLIAAHREWAEYLEDINGEVQHLEKEAMYSSVDKECEVDFSIKFENRQKIQTCQSKLLKVLHALDTNIGIVQGCERRRRSLAKLSDTPESKIAMLDLQAHLAELKAHEAVTQRIMLRCTSTASLLEKILEYRNSQALRLIASAQRLDGEIMARLFKNMAQDSNLLRTLTMMASLYLPASLLATIFSSNLVQRGAGKEISDHSHLVIAQDFWVYIVVTLPLVGMTIVLMAWMRRRSVVLAK